MNVGKSVVCPREGPPLRQKSGTNLHQREIWKKVGTEKVAYRCHVSSGTTPVLWNGCGRKKTRVLIRLFFAPDFLGISHRARAFGRPSDLFRFPPLLPFSSLGSARPGGPRKFWRLAPCAERVLVISRGSILAAGD